MFTLRKYADLLYKAATTLWVEGITGEPQTPSETSSEHDEVDQTLDD
jgi:hypothetical protein